MSTGDLIIYHHFQSIYDIKNWEKIGYEALLRNDLFKNPEKLFEVAKEENWLYELDTESIKMAIESFKRSTVSLDKSYLFINIFPSTLINPKFIPFLNDIYDGQVKIVFELNENELIDNLDLVQQVVKQLRRMKIDLAIDDIGKGNLEIQKLIELQPEIVKVDHYITNGLMDSKEKQLFLNLLSEYCNELNIMLILEGIEQVEELLFVKELGINFGQGYSLGRPSLLR